MRTINEEEFKRFCEEIRREAPAILDGATGSGERTRRLLSALLARVCLHLGLDLEKQTAELQDRDGFALLQTLEEHMQPEFSYAAILDRSLLSGL
jgi:hypothetical protein